MTSIERTTAIDCDHDVCDQFKYQSFEPCFDCISKAIESAVNQERRECAEYIFGILKDTQGVLALAISDAICNRGSK